MPNPIVRTIVEAVIKIGGCQRRMSWIGFMMRTNPVWRHVIAAITFISQRSWLISAVAVSGQLKRTGPMLLAAITSREERAGFPSQTNTLHGRFRFVLSNSVGNLQGIINPFIVTAQTDGYYQTTYQNVPVCRPWYGQIVCENVVVPQQVYYNNAPFNPGYSWQYWYTMPEQPEFVFFFGSDGRHHCHRRWKR